ncbi:MAG: hypothetical protein NTY19_03145, partial [Planctomycetota bacterium]|nr:hypothetical protein [Planctomycetota bacterium]
TLGAFTVVVSRSGVAYWIRNGRRQEPTSRFRLQACKRPMVRGPPGSSYYVTASRPDQTHGRYPDLPMWYARREVFRGQVRGALHRNSGDAARMGRGPAFDILWAVTTASDDQGIVRNPVHHRN